MFIIRSNAGPDVFPRRNLRLAAWRILCTLCVGSRSRSSSCHLAPPPLVCCRNVPSPSTALFLHLVDSRFALVLYLYQIVLHWGPWSRLLLVPAKSPPLCNMAGSVQGLFSAWPRSDAAEPVSDLQVRSGSASATAGPLST